MTKRKKVQVNSFCRNQKRRLGNFKGDFDEKIEIEANPLKCMSWNVRNLGKNFERPGIKSRGFKFKNRLEQIAQTILKFDLDICILLETGNDSEKACCSYFNKHKDLTSWKAFCTKETEETYTIILKNGNHKLFESSSIELIGDTEINKEKYRQNMRKVICFEGLYHTVGHWAFGMLSLCPLAVCMVKGLERLYFPIAEWPALIISNCHSNPTTSTTVAVASNAIFRYEAHALP